MFPHGTKSLLTSVLVTNTLQLYVPVTVHHEQSVKKGYQRDATIEMIYCQLQILIID